MSSAQDGAVTVVVIAYNDAEHIAQAVTSALAQGDAVGEVVVVDDASTDDTPHVLGQLAATEPRVRVVRRAVNSGGCGTPRNDGIDAARHPWLVFLDSDDVLAPKAVDTLLAVALRHGADVTAGLCVRRELPGGREIPWQEALFTTEAVYDGVAGRPQTLWDTLSVNKMYRRDFLLSRRIRFPDGAAHYEDFVFTARVYAAGPRFAVTPETVYVWHVRYGTGQASISLRRDRIQNWQDRVNAHQQVLEIMRGSGDQDLLIAAQTKFLEFDLAVYLRELPQRTPEYQDDWWRIAREHVGAFETEAVRRATPAARWRTEVLLGRERRAVDVRRLAELAADPPRLAPPYAGDARRPLWDEADSIPEAADEIVLDGLGDTPVAQLPFYALGNVGAGRRLVLELRLGDLYGRTAHAGPERATVELRHRVTGAAHRYEAAWEAGPDGHGWRAVVTADVAALCEGGTITTWDAWVTLTFRDGESTTRPLRAGSGLRRLVRMGRRGRVLLLQPYATSSGGLAVHVTDGLSGMRRVVAGRVARRVRS
ncbi:glycosyltransferase [Streptomyces broussonetiae]|uniref:Glycosyltransferase n=1 Tax=Streptomyces broussonetiae TaxID=2686304 RepID=A0A6I6NGM9_9ACTN|nr:glycosyltransferase family 2 protein [Streptomyces broussonetiae]QHA08095.1 glycosyltransferase [Streptomyces broussonetiae]